MTYTVISRNPNSWTRTAQGNFYEINHECGHHHRTLAGAIKCMKSLAGTTASLHAGIEIAVGDQMYDGRAVDAETIAEERWRLMAR